MAELNLVLSMQW